MSTFTNSKNVVCWSLSATNVVYSTKVMGKKLSGNEAAWKLWSSEPRTVGYCGGTGLGSNEDSPRFSFRGKSPDNLKTFEYTKTAWSLEEKQTSSPIHEQISKFNTHIINAYNIRDWREWLSLRREPQRKETPSFVCVEHPILALGRRPARRFFLQLLKHPQVALQIAKHIQ